MNANGQELISVGDLFNDAAKFVDKHLKEARWSVYGLGLLGLGITLRSLRFVTKFTNANGIPKSFIRKHVKLCGTVENIGNDGILHVNHKPIVSMPWHKFSKGLVAVNLIGVQSNISTAYRLKFVTEKQKVWFQPITRADNVLNCIVYKKQALSWSSCLNIDVVRQGTCRFATFDNSLSDNKLYRDLHKKLVDAEREAKRKRVGLWYSPSTWDMFRSKIPLPSLIFRSTKTAD